MNGSRMVCEASRNGEVVKDILYDEWYLTTEYRKASQNDTNQNFDFSPFVIALYDVILFDDTRYMAVEEDGKWFYIGQDGNKISRDYQDASRFTADGYALVNVDGTACLINEQFEILEQYGPADTVYASGEMQVYENEGTQNLILPTV